MVVHRKLSSFDGRSRLSTWLFGICLRVVSRHRRRAYFRFESLFAAAPERLDTRTPEAALELSEEQRLLEAALKRLSLDQRAVFALFELEGHACHEIAELMGVPLGTVYSRLHTARKSVSRSLEKAGIARREAP